MRAVAFATAIAAGSAPFVFGASAARADELGPCASLVTKADGTVTPATPCGPSSGQGVLEFGYGNRSFSGAASFGTTTYPSAALRYGVSNALEIDAYAPTYERIRIGDATLHGYSDAGAGLRYRLQSAGASTTAAFGTFTLPTGDANFTAGKAQYALGLANLYSVAPRVSVQSSIAYASQYQNGLTPTWYASYQPAVALVASATKSTALYLGASGTTKVAPGLGPEYRLDAAVRHQLAAGTALEVGVDDGLTSVNGTRSHAIDIAVTQLVK